MAGAGRDVAWSQAEILLYRDTAEFFVGRVQKVLDFWRVESIVMLLSQL